jgi:hypothetical protein
MGGLNIEITVKGIKDIKIFTEKEKDLLQKGFETGMHWLFEQSQNIVSEHVRTGNLGASGRVIIPGFLQGELVWSATYASYLQEGTKPHVIRPKRKKALRWIVEGVTYFSKKVQHPGTMPVPYAWGYLAFEDNINKVGDFILSKITDNWEGL